MTNAFNANLEIGVGDEGYAPAGIPRGREPVPIFQESRWALGKVWRSKENSTPIGN